MNNMVGLTTFEGLVLSNIDPTTVNIETLKEYILFIFKGNYSKILEYLFIKKIISKDKYNQLSLTVDKKDKNDKWLNTIGLKELQQLAVIVIKKTMSNKHLLRDVLRRLTQKMDGKHSSAEINPTYIRDLFDQWDRIQKGIRSILLSKNDSEEMKEFKKLIKSSLPAKILRQIIRP